MKTTIYTTDVVWGASSFSSTGDLKVGKTNADKYYKGRIKFGTISDEWRISSVKLYLTRIDSNNAHTLKFGGSSSDGFNSTLDFSVDVTIPKGTGQNVIDLTSYIDTMQGYPSDWYIHVRHGSGSNSYTEFNGDEGDNSVKPQLVVEYETHDPTTLNVSRTTCPLNSSITFSVATGDPNVASFSVSYYMNEDVHTGQIADKQDISNPVCMFTPPYSWKDSFSGTTATLQVYLSVYDGAGWQIGGIAGMATITLTIPNANPPVISGASFSDTSNVYNTFGVYVQGHSTMKMSISASADSSVGAYITNYSTSVNGSTYNGSSFTIGKVGSTSLSARVMVTDSEGQTASKSFSCSLAAYSPPSVSNVRSGRCDSSGNDKQDGTYMKMSFTVGSTTLGSRTVNAVSYSIMYKLSTASGWTTYKTVNTGTTSATVTDLVLTGVTFDTDKAYDLKVVASDYFQTSEVKEDVSTKEVLINLMKGGKGIAFGQLSQIEGAIEMGWRTVFHERGDSATSLLYIGNNTITSDTVANWVSQGFCYGYYSSKYLANQPTSSGFILSMPYCTSTQQAATSATMIVQLWVSAGNDETVSKRYGNYSGFGEWNELGGISTLKKAYPVGSIYMSTNPTNPSTLFGFGTWERFAAGRMPMGAGGGYTGIGGSAEVTLTESQIPSHSHGPGANTVSSSKTPDLFLTGVSGGVGRSSKIDEGTEYISFIGKVQDDLGYTATTSSVGGGQAHNNLPPYIVCYMWQRIE